MYDDWKCQSCLITVLYYQEIEYVEFLSGLPHLFELPSNCFCWRTTSATALKPFCHMHDHFWSFCVLNAWQPWGFFVRRLFHPEIHSFCPLTSCLLDAGMDILMKKYHLEISAPCKPHQSCNIWNETGIVLACIPGFTNLSDNHPG